MYTRHTHTIRMMTLLLSEVRLSTHKHHNLIELLAVGGLSIRCARIEVFSFLPPVSTRLLGLRKKLEKYNKMQSRWVAFT